MEILAELPKLDAADRREIMDRLFDLEEQSLLTARQRRRKCRNRKVLSAIQRLKRL
jgi:mRNA-degrading endonuclease RelE of RelBE toxin-antitoxin system